MNNIVNNLLMLSVNLELLSTIAVVAFVVGIILGLIEVFVPGFGIFGILGIIFCIAGVVLRMIAGDSLLVTGIIVIVIFVLFSIIFLILGKSARTGRLSKTDLVSTGTALPKGKTAGTGDYEIFMNLEGETKTELRPVGKAEFQNIIIEVVSHDSSHIDKGEKVQIIHVEGQRVLVKKI